MNKPIHRARLTRRIFNLLLAFSFIPQVITQRFDYAAPLEKVETQGVYRIVLSPELRAFAQYELRDIRILDSLHKEVPYLQISDPIIRNYTDFPVLSTHSCVVIYRQPPSPMILLILKTDCPLTFQRFRS